MLLSLKLPTGDITNPSSTTAPVPSGLPRGLSGGLVDSVAPAIQTGLNFLLTVGVIISVVMILWAGIRFITSTGDPNKLAGAKSSLIYAIIGLVILLGAYFIVNGVLVLLGAKPGFFWNLGQAQS